MDRTYIAIDLKSFFASVECVERGLDPLNTNLVVADETRTEKTICLAVSPSLKAYGIGGRARLFEVIQEVEKVNNKRLSETKNHRFFGESYIDSELKKDKSLCLGYIIAPPQMKKYIEYSNNIFNIYKKMVAEEDIHVYSVDEVFIDATFYLKKSGMTAKEFCNILVKEIFNKTGITATAGIGPNLYLCKIAMDIMAKKMKPNSNNYKIAELSEKDFRRNLWEHTPLSSFWGIGKGVSDRLAKHGIYTMGDIALQSVVDEDILYKEFGIEAEILIDHAWGYESCTMQDIKEYKTDNHSISNGQVLKEPYDYEKGKIIIKEMADNLCYDLLKSNLETDQILLTVGYDRTSMNNYKGQTTTDRYGLIVPKSAKCSKNLLMYTYSQKKIIAAFTELYEKNVNKNLFIRRMSVTANHVRIKNAGSLQLSFYDDSEERLEEEKMQKAVLKIKNKYGKNAILKGIDLKDGATTIERNGNLGGHKA